jgi:hypothetical protein
LSEIGGLGRPSPAADGDPDGAEGLGREAKTAGRCHGQSRHLGHDSAEAAMTQALLETGQQRLVVPGLDVDDTTGKQAGLRQGGSKEILARYTPQHLARGTRRDSGCEQRGRRAIDRPVAAARHFMQRAEGQSPTRQNPVNNVDSKRQNVTAMGRRAGEALNALAELIDDGFGRGRTHYIPATRWPDDMFLICSNVDARVNLELFASQAMPHRNVGEAIANKTGICGRVFLA